MNKPVECQKLNQINKVIMKNILISALLFFAVTSAFTQKKEKDYNEAIKLIEVWLDAQRDFDRLPGISAIVVVSVFFCCSTFARPNAPDQI